MIREKSLWEELWFMGGVLALNVVARTLPVRTLQEELYTYNKALWL